MNADMRRQLAEVRRDLAELRGAFEPQPVRHARGGRGDGGGATEQVDVVIRSIDLAAQEMLVQRIDYINDPPTVQPVGSTVATIYAHGAVFTAYPPIGQRCETFVFDKSSRPRVVDTGTAVGGTVNTITLAADINEADDFYNGESIAIVGGAGTGQTKAVKDFDGAGRVVTIEGSWSSPLPNSASSYQIGRPEELLYQDFFPFEVRKKGSRWFVYVVLRIAPGIRSVDPGLKNEGGGCEGAEKGFTAQRTLWGRERIHGRAITDDWQLKTEN